MTEKHHSDRCFVQTTISSKCESHLDENDLLKKFKCAKEVQNNK